MHDDLLPDAPPDDIDDVAEFRESKRREHFAAQGLEYEHGITRDPKKDFNRKRLLLARAKELLQLADQNWTPSLGKQLAELFQQIEEIE